MNKATAIKPSRIAAGWPDYWTPNVIGQLDEAYVADTLQLKKVIDSQRRSE